MTLKEFNELKKKYSIYDDIDDVLDFVSELLHKVARETEKNEPYATNTIRKLDDASYEVWHLIEYVSELEDKKEDFTVQVEGGHLHAYKTGDIDYPGVCVEFVPDEPNESVSTPTVVVEKPTGEDLRALVWGDNDNEDYTAEIVFD